MLEKMVCTLRNIVWVRRNSPFSGTVFPDDIIDILNTEPLGIVSVANQSKHLCVHHHGNRHQQMPDHIKSSGL